MMMSVLFVSIGTEITICFSSKAFITHLTSLPSTTSSLSQISVLDHHPPSNLNTFSPSVRQHYHTPASPRGQSSWDLICANVYVAVSGITNPYSTCTLAKDHQVASSVCVLEASDRVIKRKFSLTTSDYRSDERHNLGKNK